MVTQTKDKESAAGTLTQAYYSQHEAAQILGTSFSFVQARVQDGTFKPVRIGRLIKIPAEQLTPSYFDKQAA